MRKIEYLEEAKKHEVAFRAILDKYKVPNKDMTVEELYHEYSQGDRYGRWTILDFRETESGIFLFSNENIAFLSGSGRDDLWKIENGEAVIFERGAIWMS